MPAADQGGVHQDFLGGPALTDKVAIITGGSRAIGRATAIAAAARGFKICVGYASNEAAARHVVSAIEAKNGKAIAVKCDVGNESDIIALFKAADAFGTLGALVNNAGIVGTTSRVDEMSAERIQRMMAVNVTGSILCARDRAHRLSSSVPMKRVGTADEIANAIVWLMSDEASYVTSAILDVSGGR